MTVKDIGCAMLLLSVCVLARALGQGNNTQVPSSRERLEKIQRIRAAHAGKTGGELIEAALQADREFDRHSAFHELEWRRHEQIDKLIKVVGDKDAPSPSRFFSARLLGLYRDYRAIPVLVENLDWKCPDDVIVDSISPFNGYPCAAALAEFRSECAGPILGNLAGHSKAKAINNEMLVLRMYLLEIAYPNRVEPWGTDDAVSVVERYIERRALPDGSDAIKNIERLLEKLKGRRNAR